MMMTMMMMMMMTTVVVIIITLIIVMTMMITYSCSHLAWLDSIAVPLFTNSETAAVTP